MEPWGTLEVTVIYIQKGTVVADATLTVRKQNKSRIML